MGEQQRKGQKLCNWIHLQGYSNEDVHIMLFHMSNEDFDMVMNTPWSELYENRDKKRSILNDDSG